MVLVVRYMAQAIKSVIGDGRGLGCSISYVVQRRFGGTADALRTCESELAGEDQFIVAYGDDFYDEQALGRFVRATRKHAGIVIGAAQAEDSRSFGALTIRNGLIREIREKVASGGKEKVNAGIYLMDDSIFKATEKTPKSLRGEYELTDTVKLLIREGKQVEVFHLKRGEWVGLSYPWDLLDANRLVLDKETGSRKAASIERDVVVRGAVTFSAGCTVKSGTYIEGPAFLGENCALGPNSYIRPYTSIGKNVKVGAGSEVKGSILMDGVKVPHLSYLGDSIVGEGSSLGAGTLTANLRFDEAIIRSQVRRKLVPSGRKKLGAIIGDNVRTGINVSLLPGVKVGSGAWIGPGVVVGRDIPDGARVKT